MVIAPSPKTTVVRRYITISGVRVIGSVSLLRKNGAPSTRYLMNDFDTDIGSPLALTTWRCIARFPSVCPFPIRLFSRTKYGTARQNPTRRPQAPRREKKSKNGRAIKVPAIPTTIESIRSATIRRHNDPISRSGGRLTGTSGSPVSGGEKGLINASQ